MVRLLYAAEDLHGMERNYKVKHELRRKLKRISLHFFEESFEPLQVLYAWIVFALHCMMSGECNVSLETEKNETNRCCWLARILLFFQL